MLLFCNRRVHLIVASLPYIQQHHRISGPCMTNFYPHLQKFTTPSYDTADLHSSHSRKAALYISIYFTRCLSHRSLSCSMLYYLGVVCEERFLTSGDKGAFPSRILASCFLTILRTFRFLCGGLKSDTHSWLSTYAYMPLFSVSLHGSHTQI